MQDLLTPWPRYEGTTIDVWHTERGIPSIGWIWLDRRGVRHIEHFHVPVLDEAAKEQTRQAAMAAGYPGHGGGRWNYFVADIRAWLERRGLLAQPLAEKR